VKETEKGEVDKEEETENEEEIEKRKETETEKETLKDTVKLKETEVEDEEDEIVFSMEETSVEVPASTFTNCKVGKPKDAPNDPPVCPYTELIKQGYDAGRSTLSAKGLKDEDVVTFHCRQFHFDQVLTFIAIF
jgi:hypothetical protein